MALLTDDIFANLPNGYVVPSLSGATSRAHFEYLLERALQHLEVSRRLKNARAPEFFLAIGAWTALAIGVLAVIVVVRRRKLHGHWWKLDRILRLVLVVGAVWAVTFYLLQDEADLRIVLLPPLALIVLYFAYRHLVDAPERPQRPDA